MLRRSYKHAAPLALREAETMRPRLRRSQMFIATRHAISSASSVGAKCAAHAAPTELAGYATPWL